MSSFVVISHHSALTANAPATAIRADDCGPTMIPHHPTHGNPPNPAA